MATNNKAYRSGYGHVRGVVAAALFAGTYPRIDLPASSAVERRITRITAGMEYLLNVAGTALQKAGGARFLLWKGTVNEAELFTSQATGVTQPDGADIEIEFIVPTNETVVMVGTVEAPLMILNPGESAQAIMGDARGIDNSSIANYIASFSVGGIDLPIGKKPRDYEMR